MVLAEPFRCPTRVYAQSPFHEVVAALVGGRRWALATSDGWTQRGGLDALVGSVGEPAAVLDSVAANPSLSLIEALAAEMPAVEVVVALGGGSVIDAAKGLVSRKELGGDSGAFVAHLRDEASLPHGFSPVPIIAVPTTSGTGSEVTRWATIWDEDGKKRSLHHPALYPVAAVLDAHLCTSMPARLTLASGLDAVSHAMEAVWNRNHTTLCDRLATSAIASLRRHLGRATTVPEDLDVRRQVQNAALIAGMAMGTTQTALAHSISYPFTARFGMPHGFACSFTLAEVARFNMVEDVGRLTAIADGLGCALAEIPSAIEGWFAELELGRHLSRHVRPDAIECLGDDLITPARARNNLRGVDAEAARALAKASLEGLQAT